MRLHAASICLLAVALVPLSAQTAAPSPVPARDVIIDNLLSERDSEKALQAIIADARKNNISEQAILEARFLFHVDRREDQAIATMLPEFLAQRERFKIQDSVIFGVKEDWLAVTEYVQAIAALGKGDKDAFKKHITEAFWLSPRQASAFAPHIDRMRLEEAMRSVKIDFTVPFASLGGGDPVPLGKLIAGRKAMVLHFWSPVSRDSEATLPDYAITAKTLGGKGIAMVSLLPENNPELLANARTLLHGAKAEDAGAWLIDNKENPLARDLRIQVIPVFVLVSNEGRVLFNGDPGDDGFWEALRKIDPSISRPGMDPPPE